MAARQAIVLAVGRNYWEPLNELRWHPKVRGVDPSWDCQLIPTPHSRAKVNLDEIAEVRVFRLAEVFKEKEDYLGYVVQFGNVMDVDVLVRCLYSNKCCYYY